MGTHKLKLRELKNQSKEESQEVMRMSEMVIKMEKLESSTHTVC